MVFITKTSFFAANTTSLANAITVDLLFTVPFVYFLLIRKTTIPKTTVVPFIIIGVVTSSFILPPANQHYLSLFKIWGLPVIELAVVSFILYKLWKAIQKYRLHKKEAVDFFTILKNTCQEVLPKAAVIPFATEIAVFYYGFISWKKRELKKNEFSYHKNSGTISLLIAIIFIVAIETVVLHILLSRWSNTVAWVLTFLSIYSGIQIFGFLKSMLKRPITITGDRIYLRYGIMTESVIYLKNIDSIELSSKDFEPNTASRKLSLLGELEGHNVIIHLKEENTMVRLYGKKRSYKNLAFYVDDKVAFVNKVQTSLE